MLDRHTLRERLVTRAADLKTRHRRVTDHLHNRDRDVPRNMTEQGEFLENDLVLEELDVVLRAEIEAVAAMLRRIDSGAWSTCDACGDDIGLARLEAVPTASLCAECAAGSVTP